MNRYNRVGRRIKRIFVLANLKLIVIYGVGYYLAYIIAPDDEPVKLYRLRARNSALEAVKAAINAYRAGIPQNTLRFRLLLA